MCTDTEREMLADIAETDGVTASDVVRRYIRERHAELFGRPEPKAKAGRRRKKS